MADMDEMVAKLSKDVVEIGGRQRKTSGRKKTQRVRLAKAGRGTAG